MAESVKEDEDDESESEIMEGPEDEVPATQVMACFKELWDAVDVGSSGLLEKTDGWYESMMKVTEAIGEFQGECRAL